MVDIRPIRSEADYDWALAQIERYFGKEPAPGTAESDRFSVLADLIEAYEARHWPIEGADPVEVIRYRMETRGYTQQQLAEILGSRSRASEVLARRRPLTLEMVRKLSATWRIPADALIGFYRTNIARPKRRAASGRQHTKIRAAARRGR